MKKSATGLRRINYGRFVAIAMGVFFLLLLTSEASWAQCPMCRMSAESNLANGGSDGAGLNRGILYMLAAPYLIIASVAYVWWRNRKREGDEEENLVTSQE